MFLEQQCSHVLFLFSLQVFSPAGVSVDQMRAAVMAGFQLPSSFVIGSSDAFALYGEGQVTFSTLAAEETVASVVGQLSFLLSGPDLSRVSTVSEEGMHIVGFSCLGRI